MATMLAIETSADACSLALLREGEMLERHEILPKSHTQHILPMADALLADAGLQLRQLDGIAFGRGPGSFTGLRVCASVVQGLALAADLPCVPVSSLQALAQTALRKWEMQEGDEIACCIDARMDEVYWSRYRVATSGVEPLGDEHLSAPEAVVVGENVRFIVGSGLNYADRLGGLQGSQDAALLARASAVAEIGALELSAGRVVSAEQALPLYLRDNVAWR